MSLSKVVARRCDHGLPLADNETGCEALGHARKPVDERARQAAAFSSRGKECTCVGACKGAAGLGPGWRCVMAAALPPQPQHLLHRVTCDTYLSNASCSCSPVHAAADGMDTCQAEEWQRDGRGLWAMRVCMLPSQHDKRHEFSSWRYHVSPPSSVGGAHT